MPGLLARPDPAGAMRTGHSKGAHTAATAAASHALPSAQCPSYLSTPERLTDRPTDMPIEPATITPRARRLLVAPLAR